jgi:hypothetical protein
MEKRHQVLYIPCEEPAKASVTYIGERISDLYIRFSGCAEGKVSKGSTEQVENYTFFVEKEMKVIN